ncbi:hypothetical protein BAUCODRAFT_31688 [Baudoinia panamericana UAMH 10762]|uniref:Uncharacterized protein n=1 Tax=Baudoinia panamericana (strain UAMH 10762) TaxID=717646 RepID=M2NJP9_BAUPA|nr:uncharacterized protein BAUCODRAFT_31688 [Baudoinia panamericana UAMH 10762]EMC99370.1 hypothetical protein BAUCODRAFT_31688 [Baudoinia panamericana UAMH 10762]
MCLSIRPAPAAKERSCVLSCKRWEVLRTVKPLGCLDRSCAFVDDRVSLRQHKGETVRDHLDAAPCQ